MGDQSKPGMIQSTIDSMLFAPTDKLTLQTHGIHWENFANRGLANFRYNPQVVHYKDEFGNQRPIGLLTRGPNGQGQFDPSAPTYVFFHGKGGTALGTVDGQGNLHTEFRQGFLTSFPTGANIIAVQMDRDPASNPGPANFEQQYQALTEHFKQNKLNNIHVFGESMGSYDAANFGAALTEQRGYEPNVSVSITAPFAHLSTSASDRQFGSASGKISKAAASGILSATGNELNMFTAIDRLVSASTRTILPLHITTTQETQPGKPGHFVMTNDQESVATYAANSWGRHFIRSHQNALHFSHDPQQTVNATQMGIVRLRSQDDPNITDKVFGKTETPAAGEASRLPSRPQNEEIQR